MTNRLVRGRGHTYRIDGQRVPSVTGILKMLDKPGLVSWAARESAGYAIDNWDELSTKPLSERYRLIEDARFRSNKQKREQGKRIHAMAEKLAEGQEVQPPAEIVGQVEAVARFLDRWEFRTYASEVGVGNFDHMYGGTLDTIQECPKLGRCLIDWKNNPKGPYQDSALQLVGYERAQFLLRKVELTGPKGGKRVTYDQEPMPEIDGCYIAKILADDVDLHPVRTSDLEFAAFLYLREVHDWWDSVRNSDSERFDPPVGEPIYPETYEDSENEA